MADRRVCG